jgi:rifampicin phosphotransferase
MTSMDKFVLDFTEIDKKSLPYVGGKGANLGEMTKAGFPVPQGFCVTTVAYHVFIQESHEMNQFYSQLDEIHAADLDAHGLDEIRQLGKAIREHLEQVAIPSDVKTAILAAWQQTGQDKAYAIRSSATAEDLPTASFAGQQETYLNVRGEEQILNSVRRCWASLFTDRAIAYRAKNEFDHRNVFLSVVIQEMVFPEVSGIMFTADPISGNRQITSIDASFGLGEALVSGMVSADLYQVLSLQILKKKISEKKIAIYSVPEGGTVTKDLPPDQQKAQALSDEKIIELSKLGDKIEEHYGSEQDIEWCLADGEFYIVQSRPITTLYPVPKVADNRIHAFVSVGHQQMMTAAIRPLGISVLRTFFSFKAGGFPSSESQYVLEAGGHLFFDITKLLYLKPVKRILPKLLSNIDERIGSAVAELVQRPEFQHVADKRLRKSAMRIARYGIKNVLLGLLYRDPLRAREFVDNYMKQSLMESRQYLFGVSGVERIRRVEETIGNLLASVLRVMSRYLGSGLLAMALVSILAKKWHVDGDDVHLLNKSLPGNVTSELGLQIGDLADCARQYPEVVRYLEMAEAETFFAGFNRVPGGSEFADKFEKFLNSYGMRCPGEIDVTNVRWREDPTALVTPILGHIRTQKSGAHRQNFEQGRIEAEEAAKRLIARVRKTHGGVFKARLMKRLVKVYRNLAGMREYPKYILIQHFDLCKQAVLEEAEKLVETGILNEENDVFYLSLDEILALVSGTFAGDVLQVIEDRKRQYEQDKNLTPPRVMTSVGEIISGTMRDVKAPNGALIGTPVSAGVVEGYARVVFRPEEAKLNSGEIMIAPFTDPGWTPLFHTAQALVMEVGGLMTHGAVVAREYGIPAVVGIDDATKIIKDGDYIRVDGTKGYVEVLRTAGGS